MKNSRFLTLLIILIMISGISLAQTRGLSRVTIKANGKNIELYKGSHALLIGVSDYTSGWPDLEGIPSELLEIEKSLVKHGFQVTKVINPNNRELQKAYENFIDQYGYDTENRLLFFFSGHGYSRKKGKKGYLVPADAPDPRKDLKGFLRKALSMSRILNWSREIESKHALFLFDSCFSGTIFKTRALPKVPPHISSLTAKAVRQFITAGSSGEEVPANSVFTPSVVKALRGEADLNRDGFVTGTELGMYLHQKVMGYNGGQTPQYGKIKDPELDEGDFVFRVGTQNLSSQKLVAKQNTTINLESDKLKFERERFELEKKMWEERKKLEAERRKFEELKKAHNKQTYNYDESNDNIIYSEYFNNNKKNWSETNNRNITTSVRSGSYYFSHKRDKNAWLTWTKSRVGINPYEDFFIQTSIRKVSGVQNYGYGIAWGLRDANNNYFFQVSANGYYRVAKIQNGKYSYPIKWTKSSHINKYNSTNKLGVKKLGNKLYFYINDRQVNSMYFQTFMGNKIGYRIDMRQAVEIQDLIVTKIKKERKIVVFSDYFDNNRNNWALRNTGKVDLAIRNGSYYFDHKRASRSWLSWKKVNLNSYDDYTIECDMKKVKGIYNNGYGLVWGLRDASNCFFFQISGDGHYRYYKSVNGKYTHIIPWKKSPYINKYNNSYNNLTIRKRGNTLKFYINNKYVDSAFAEPFMGKNIGFRIDMKQGVSFRNLIVSKIVRN